MPEAGTNARAVKKRPSLLSPLTRPLGLAVSIAGFLLVSTLIATLIDWVGMLMGWWDRRHQLHVLTSDIQYLGSNFTTSVFGLAPAEIAMTISRKVHDWLTISLHLGGQQYAFMRILSRVFAAIEPFWQSLVYSAMTVSVRVFIVLLSIACYVIVFAVTMVDGLVQRELRKVGGGIEHAQVFHHAKTWLGRVLVISPMLYLSWPNSLNPLWIVLPSAVFFGISTFITFSTFKKYL